MRRIIILKREIRGEVRSRTAGQYVTGWTDAGGTVLKLRAVSRGIEHCAKGGCTMPGTVNELRTKLENLLHTANTRQFDPIDWQRFYEIVVFAAREKLVSEFSGSDLREFLAKKGIRKDVIRDLEFLYVHGINVVRFSLSYELARS